MTTIIDALKDFLFLDYDQKKELFANQYYETKDESKFFDKNNHGSVVK